MPRPLRTYPGGIPQHVYNRGNRRARIFQDATDFLAFLAALAHAGERTTVRLLAFCLMPNHYHLLLLPHVGGEISTYIQLVMNKHISHLQTRHGTKGTGHIYGGRHQNVPILNERHFYIAARYVEGNALAAGLVERAEAWPWCSLSTADECARLVAPWPLPRPDNWIELVNQVPSKRHLREILDRARRARKEQSWVFDASTLLAK
jgi:putative transposase